VGGFNTTVVNIFTTSVETPRKIQLHL
jgi:hypothetical protein